MRTLVSVFACFVCFVCTTVAFGQMEEWQKQLERDPRDPLAHFKIGEIFLSQNSYQAAANSFRNVLLGDSPAEWLAQAARQHLATIAALTGSARVPIPPVPLPSTFASVDGEYSEEARLAGLEGVVIVSGTPIEDRLTNLKVERPLGLGLDEKALEAAAQWRNISPLPQDTVHRLAVEFVLPEKKSRWHLVSAQFRIPQGASRPGFARVPYPIGSGITREAVDQGRFVVAVGRSAVATLSFDIGSDGRGTNFHIVSQSEATWGPQAIGLVRQWEFQPATVEGVPVTSSCTLTLVWGERRIAAPTLATAGSQ